jgi:hypothetical protein
MLGFWAFTLCAVPYAVATDTLAIKIGLAGTAVLPLMILAAPAQVSSSCDDLLDQLNDVSFLGGMPHKNRCAALRESLMNLNSGQGLGCRSLRPTPFRS